MEALHEIQVAELLGFTRVKDWERARRKGLIPAPDQELPDGPRWDRERLLAWLRGTEETTWLMDDEKELIGRDADAEGSMAPYISRVLRLSLLARV